EGAAIQLEDLRPNPFRPPLFLGDPAPRALLVVRTRRHAILRIRDVGRVLEHARILALERLVPPAQGFLEQAGCRARAREMGRLGLQWADDALSRRFSEVSDQLADGILVVVLPAAEGERSSFDGVVVLAHRAVLPVLIAMLVLEPGLEQ